MLTLLFFVDVQAKVHNTRLWNNSPRNVCANTGCTEFGTKWLDGYPTCVLL